MKKLDYIVPILVIVGIISLALSRNWAAVIWVICTGAWWLNAMIWRKKYEYLQKQTSRLVAIATGEQK